MNGNNKLGEKRSRDNVELEVSLFTIDALYKLYNKDANHMKFLNDNDLLSAN